MTNALSNAAGSSSAPLKKEEGPVVSAVARDQPWTEGLAQDQVELYYRVAGNTAYLILGLKDEAEDVAEEVIEELLRRKQSPSKAEIISHLRVLSRSRALDRLKSPKHRFRMMCRSLMQKNDEDDEYEADAQGYSCAGAEEEYLLKVEREAFAHQYAEALSHLSDLQRACFVLRVVEQLTPEEVAVLLKIPTGDVYSHTYRARNRLARIFPNGKESKRHHAEGGLPSEQVSL